MHYNYNNDCKNDFFFLATNQLPLSPVQIQPSPPYYRQPSQDDGRKVYDIIYIYNITSNQYIYIYICF